jgi:hypothetical protein
MNKHEGIFGIHVVITSIAPQRRAFKMSFLKQQRHYCQNHEAWHVIYIIIYAKIYIKCA